MARQFVAASSQGLTYAGTVTTTVPFSFAGWLYPDTLPGTQTVISIADTSASNPNRWQLALANTGAARVSARSGISTDNIDSTTTVGAGAYAHLCGVFAAADDRRVYLNGGGKNTSSVSKSPAGTDTTGVGLGPASTNTDFVDGRLGEVAIWSVALTDADAAALAKGFSPLIVRPESLVAYWPLIGRYSPEIDIVGRFDLTLVNAPTRADHPRIYLPAHGLFFRRTATGALTLVSPTLGHTANPITLAQINNLALVDAILGHTAAPMTLTQATPITLVDAVHGHTATPLTIQQLLQISFANVTIGHLATPPGLMFFQHGTTPPERMYRVPRQDRTYVVIPENRTYRVKRENRTYRVPEG